MSKNIKRILLTTMPRSGTTFFFDFLAKLFNFEKIEPRFADGLVPRAPEWDPYKFDKTYLELKDGQILCAHYQLTDEIQAIIENKETLTIHLYRDPRDAQLSATFYIKNALTHHALHNTLSRMSESDAVALMLSGGLITTIDNELVDYGGAAYFTKNTLAWITNKDVCSIKYEDFFVNPFDTIKNIFIEKKLDLNDEKLKHTLSEFSFSKFSNGRNPGEEDKASHFRKGIIGDYKNYYTELHKALCKKSIGQDLITLKYEKDYQW
ncbi:sulfotransferase domain-containing protein [Sulfurospirillum sp.]|uniref:sulfotransferase domain-containing protein n=1 Tax=Sulfurospirillum sp. TaxID=2053622 RepID=UPI002FDCE225